jgi:predicted benzoate:H+ symporter BenE
MIAAPMTAAFVLLTALAGLAMVCILERAFVVSFGGALTPGAVVTFLVTVANISISPSGRRSGR